MDSQKDDATENVTTNGVMDVQPPKKVDEPPVSPGTTVTISPDGEPTFITPTPGTSIQPQVAEEEVAASNEEQPAASIQQSNDDPVASVTESEVALDSSEPKDTQVSTEQSIPQEPTSTPAQLKESSDSESVQSSEVDNETKTETTQQQPNPMAIPPKPKKSGSPKLVILVAILVALSLAGASVYAYMKMQDTKNQEAKPTTQTEQVTEEVPKVTSEDVDAAVTDVDEQINSTDDAKDIPSESSVNDQTLGL